MLPLSFWSIPSGVNVEDLEIGYHLSTHKELSCPVKEFIGFFSAGAHPQVEESFHQPGQLLKLFFILATSGTVEQKEKILEDAISFLKIHLETVRFAVSQYLEIDRTIYHIVCPDVLTHDRGVMKNIASLAKSKGITFTLEVYLNKAIPVVLSSKNGRGSTNAITPLSKYRLAFFDHVIQAVPSNAVLARKPSDGEVSIYQIQKPLDYRSVSTEFSSLTEQERELMIELIDKKIESLNKIRKSITS